MLVEPDGVPSVPVPLAKLKVTSAPEAGLTVLPAKRVREPSAS